MFCDRDISTIPSKIERGVGFAVFPLRAVGQIQSSIFAYGLAGESLLQAGQRQALNDFARDVPTTFERTNLADDGARIFPP